VAYTIQFWRGHHCLFGVTDESCLNVEDALQRVSDLLRELMDEDEDWTGCRLEVVAECGEVILSAPVLPSMSAMARQSCH
jgi:hypothetical protein